MVRKNIQDDGSYQKSQKLGNPKGKFDNSPQMSEWEETKPGDVGVKRYRLPLDAYGDPAPGFQPIDITKSEGEPEFGGWLTQHIKGTTEKSDQGINIHINKRRDITDVLKDGVKYDQGEKKFKDKYGNTINDSDLHYEHKVAIIARDSDREHFRDRFEGKRHPLSYSTRLYETRDIEGEGIPYPDPNEEPNTFPIEPTFAPARKKSIKKDKK